jgi:hypothetical protein
MLFIKPQQIKNYIYIQGLGFVRKETKSLFRKNKMDYQAYRNFLPFMCELKPSQETDNN